MNLITATCYFLQFNGNTNIQKKTMQSIYMNGCCHVCPINNKVTSWW